MNSSLYIGATGMKGLAQGMQVTTNNLANVSTIGYKQQQVLFSEIFPQDQANNGEWWNNQEESRVAVGQVGMGLQVEAVRTIFTQGPLESTNSVTDLAINGKGYFQVTDGNRTFYTRAGDFQTDDEGVWRTPTGLALNGYKLNPDGSQGELQPVQIDKFSTLAPQATSSIGVTSNFSNIQDNAKAGEEESPFFSLLNLYDASNSKVLPDDSYAKSMQITAYDAEGNPRQLTAYFDGAGSDPSGKNVEFVIASGSTIAVNENGEAIPPQAGDGLLMSGVLQFDAAGKLVNVAAFTPSQAGSKNLEDWNVAQLENGLPVINLDGNSMTIDFGVSAADGWQNAPANAAQVGKDATLLPGMGETTASNSACTAVNASAFNDSIRQNGYAEGVLNNISVNQNGIIQGQFSNGQTADLWQIPVCTFTSEYNLYREGGNLFTATEECGEMTMGMAGTENLGSINAYNIENSNVDMAQEMVSMILTQRGFQSNSKVVTTADEMLRKAMELKR